MKNQSTSPGSGQVHPAPLDSAADKNGRTLDVDPDSKKRQLELQGELEHSDGPKRAQIQRQVTAEESKSAGQSTSVTKK